MEEHLVVHDNSKKKLSFVFLLALSIFILPLASAVTLDSGTILNTSVSNSSMSFFGGVIIASQVDITNTTITLINPSYQDTNIPYTLNSPITWDTENDHIDSGDFGTLFGYPNSCSTFTTTGYLLIMLLSALAIAVFVVTSVIRRGELNQMSIGGLILLFITIIIVLVLWQSSAQTLGASCGVIG